MNKCYSTDGENFNLEDMGEVLDRINDDLHEDETPIGIRYWKADAVPVLHKHIIANDDIISFLETLDDQFAEFIEDPDPVYSDVSEEAITELRDLVLSWADRYVTEGRYCRVKNVQEQTIEIEDLE